VATTEDVRNRKRIRGEFSKRMMDITGLDIQVIHGTVYLRGVIKPVRGGVGDLRAEVQLIANNIRNLGLAKDVVIDCTIRGG
jgi:hypothetical protein